MLLLALLSDNEGMVLWRTPDGDDTIIAGELLESPSIGDEWFDVVLGLRTSANGPPGVGAIEEVGVSQFERWDLVPLSLFWSLSN